MLISAIALSVTAIALAGFGGTALHAIWTQHHRFMATYCPRIENYTLESREAEPTAYDRGRVSSPSTSTPTADTLRQRARLSCGAIMQSHL